MFSECSSLESIEIPDNITYIGDTAFSYCTSLKSIEIPNSIKTIKNKTFKGCRGLESITIPDSITKIGDEAFAYCEKLKSITIPDSVTIIGEYAFMSCQKLQNVKMSNSVTTIGYRAFWFCMNLKSIKVPNSVTTIGEGAFDVGNVNIKIWVYENSQAYEILSPIYKNQIRIISDPGTPKNLILQIINNHIYLTWESVVNKYGYKADGYEIYRKGENDNEYKFITDSVYTNGYADSQANLIENYSYKIKAYFNVGAERLYSDDLLGQFESSIEVPNGISANSKSCSSIIVKWNKVDSVDGYEVYRATSENGTYSLRKTVPSGSELSYTNTSLTTGKTYYYKVRAYKVINGETVYSEFSETVSAKPILSTPIATATSKSYNSNKVEWTKVTGASGYQVYRATSENGTYSLKKTVTSGSTLSYTNTSLTTGKTYYYKVRAYRIVNDKKVYGEFSEIVSSKPIPSTPTVTLSTTSKKITVKWTKVTGASGYQVYRATSRYGTYSLKKTVTSGSTVSYTNTSLTTGKTYYYKVRAYKTVNGKKVYGNYSSVKYIKCK